MKETTIENLVLKGQTSENSNNTSRCEVQGLISYELHKNRKER